MYRILHLFRIEKFTDNFLRFIFDNFRDNYHEFWIYGVRDSSIRVNISLYKNAKCIRNIIKKLKGDEIYKFDKIIYHGIFDYEIIEYFFWNRKLLGRLYLYFWGGDKFYVQDKMKNFRKKYVIRNVHGLINIIPEEKRYMQKNYNPKGRFFCVRYGRTDFEILRNIKAQNKKEKGYIAVQIGNSATKTNRHIAILRQLSKFKNENIKIFAPLSYGDPIYAKAVIKEGKRIFGKKFVGITGFIKEAEYYQFLNNMDISIFDINRQQALGNIFSLLYLGKKVFLKDNSVLAHYFRTENHCIINTMHEIEQMAFEEFIKFPEEYQVSNEDRLVQMFDLAPLMNGIILFMRN